MGEMTVKLHNVMHDRWDNDRSVSLIEERMERSVLSDHVTNIRIAKGNMNSPVFITYDTNRIMLDAIKRDCQRAIDQMARNVPGINVEKTVTFSNMLVKP